MFTILECHTICLLYLLRCVFKKLAVYKPIASKEGNSEVYVICLGFLGRTSCDNVLQELIERMGVDFKGSTLFQKEDLSELFLKEVEGCANFFTNVQARVIERNINLFRSCAVSDKNALNKIRKQVGQLFIDNFDVRALPSDGFFLGKQSYYRKGAHISSRDESGTFAERQFIKDNDPSALIALYKSKLESIHLSWPANKEVLWMSSTSLLSETAHKIDLKDGKPFKTILSSRFCTNDLLIIFNDLVKNTLPVENYDFWSDSEKSFFCHRISCSANSDYKIVDVSEKSWISNYHTAQAECVQSLLPTIRELKTNNNLILLGLPLLTQFNVGLVFLLARHFQQVGLACPRVAGNCVIFEGLLSSNFEELETIFNEIAGNPEKSYVSLVNITSFGDEFLDTVIHLNQILLRKTCLVMAYNFQ